MKQSFVLTAMIFSALAINAQNLTNVQTSVVYTNVNTINTQQATNYNFNNDINPSYAQSTANNIEVQVQTNNRGGRGSSALRSFGNSTDIPQTNKQNKTTNHKPQVQTNVSNIVNDDNVNRGTGGNTLDNNESFRPFRGNVFQRSSDNNVGNENRGRGGNIEVNEADNNSNPVVNDAKQVASKPVVQDYPGMDFKPSGLSGRDYSNGGKLKKGQKNFYTGSAKKYKKIHKKRPSHKKVKHHTSKCAKW